MQLFWPKVTQRVRELVPDFCFRDYQDLSNSTVLEQPFLYVQWSQTITLFPVIQTCKFIALQPLFPFMQHTRYRPALTRLVQDHGNALANLR